MLVENRYNRIKEMSDKKDSFDFVTNLDASDTKVGVTDTYFSSKKKVNTNEAENILSRHFNNEFSLLETGLASSMASSNHSTDSRLTLDKDIDTKLVPVNLENIKANINSHNNDQFIENHSHFSRKMIDFVPDLSFKKVIAEKKEHEIIKNFGGSAGTIQAKISAPPVINLMSKSEISTKDDVQDGSNDIKRRNNEINVKSSRHLVRKGKKGVDSLLEKLENCNKKISSTDNLVSNIFANMEEKDTNSVKSMSPEYYKSRSPNNREDDVVSPSFSNEDSNDTKQRRKRKLGKPVRLAKDFKLDQEDTAITFKKSKLPIKSDTIECLVKSNEESIPHSSLLCENQKNKSKINELENTEINSMEIHLTEHQQIGNELKSSNFNKKRLSLSENTIKFEKRTDNLNCSNVDSKPTRNFKIDISHYSIQDSQRTRARRHSECSINTLNINKRKRRKSCDDIRESFYETVPKFNNTNDVITFNEVESQLEKMFAGIIETEKDVVKKTEVSVDQSGLTLELDDEQKENLQSEKVNNQSTSNGLLSNPTGNHDNKNNKKKKIPRIRPHRNKATNSLKEVCDASVNIVHKDKEQFVCQKSLKKSAVLKRKNKNIKLQRLTSIMYTSCNTGPVKAKGPVIQIKKSKSSPMYVRIVNASREDDEERNKEKRKTINNGIAGRGKTLSYQNNLDYRGKTNNTGLFNSTLSVRYDAHTADATWICVFCKRGPHFIIPGDSSRPHPNVTGPHIVTGSYTVPAGVLSDLFGPYLIGKNYVEDNIMSPDEYEIAKEQKQGNKNKRSLRHAGIAEQFLAKVSKRKRKSSNNISNICIGMTMLDNDEQRWEVWLHEQCIVWATGVYLTGGRLSGLQDAVWDAAKSVCDSCGLSGANIGCIKRGCKSVTHYCCALTTGWYLDVDQYIPTCNFHRIT